MITELKTIETGSVMLNINHSKLTINDKGAILNDRIEKISRYLGRRLGIDFDITCSYIDSFDIYLDKNRKSKLKIKFYKIVP